MKRCQHYPRAENTRLSVWNPFESNVEPLMMYTAINCAESQPNVGFALYFLFFLLLFFFNPDCYLCFCFINCFFVK